MIMHRLFCLMCALLIVLVMVGGCSKKPVPAPDDQFDTPKEPSVPEQPEQPNEPEPEEPKEYRILLTSDIHCTHLAEWYGVSYRERMQHWVDAVLAEHERQPFDLIVIMGDVSLDFWQHNGGGSYINEEYSSTDEFVSDFVGQLPGRIPVFMLAGNHEQYANEDWLDLTGNERQGSYVLGDQLFLFLDTFGGDLDPDHHHDGKYTGVDMKFVNEQMAAHPDMDVWLIAHYFDMNKESDEFRQLLKMNDSIRGLFQGHTHLTTPIELGEEYNGLVIAQTGNFAYTKDPDVVGSFWGFRDLVIGKEGATSSYIIVESEAKIDGKLTHVDRKEIQVVCYQ
jgi:3',5'-cyclic AMP phosphodiesterase CpdA